MKFLFAAVLALIAMALVPGSVSAQSNDAILRRLAALESENAALRDRVGRLEGRTVVAAHMPPAASQPPSRPTASRPLAAYAAATRSPAAPAPDWRLPMAVDWTGIHVGIFSGYALGRWIGTAEDYPHQPVNGWLGGVALGYDHQMNSPWVVGVEADIAIADVKQTDNYSDSALTLRLDYLATLRGRLGYAWDRHLVYLTGGVAAGHLNLTANQYHPGGPGFSPFQTSDNHWHYGYALGAGTQWAFLGNASLKIEYLWINLAEQTYVLPRAPGFTGDNTSRVAWNGHTAKVGLNWLLH